MTKPLNLSYRIGINDTDILPNSFDNPSDALAFVQAIQADPTLVDDLDEDETIWKIDVEVRDEDDDIVDVFTVFEAPEDEIDLGDEGEDDDA